MNNEGWLSVTEVTRHIKRRFESDELLRDVWIRGELSNVKKHSRGHLYFTLKDEQSRMQSVMFAGHNRYLNFVPENGMNVLIRGEITVYEPYGQYQLYAKEMQPDGIGNLYLAFEQLKEKLTLEGLFSEEHKQVLPTYPEHIGIVTSPTGAAVRDIVITLRRRYPAVKMTLLPAIVQGDDAAPSVVRAIRQANASRLFDILIVGRGGGSIEELWAFNEEMVARAIYESHIPIISAVGHETDFTIADFVADVRAATPTAAAEIAVPDIVDMERRLMEGRSRMARAMQKRCKTYRDQLNRLQKSYAFRYPKQLVQQKQQELDRLIDTMEGALDSTVTARKNQFEQATKALHRLHPHSLIEEAKGRLQLSEKNLVKSSQAIVSEHKQIFSQLIAKLDALSPLKVMDRGYSLAYTKDEQLLKSVEQVTIGDEMRVQVKDGVLNCHVDMVEK